MLALVSLVTVTFMVSLGPPLEGNRNKCLQIEPLTKFEELGIEKTPTV